jgi:hypothetical protein
MGTLDWFWDDPRHRYQMPKKHYMPYFDHIDFTFWIADPHFCKSSVRQKAGHILQDAYGVTPEWIFFANDPAQCKLNVITRADGRKVMGMVHAMSQVYEIPPHATMIPVWRPQSVKEFTCSGG